MLTTLYTAAGEAIAIHIVYCSRGSHCYTHYLLQQGEPLLTTLYTAAGEAIAIHIVYCSRATPLPT